MKSIASLSIDLDNKWSYLKTHGDPDWERFPTFLDEMVAHVLDFADRRDIRMTFFVVGQDAELPANRDVLSALAETRHEIGNHSHFHEPWLHRKTDAELKEEIRRAESAIGEATGRSTRGFRAPGYSLSKGTVEALMQAGYHYDASSLPTFIGPLARLFYSRTSTLEGDEKDKRSDLFGQFRDGFRPNTPHTWRPNAEGSLLEVPVTTMPLLRLPIHTTYLLQLAQYSERASKVYLRLALRLCRLAGVQPSFLLHGLDFLGGDEVEGLEFFPAMQKSGREKRELVEDYIDIIAAHHRIVAMDEHATMARSKGVRTRGVDSLL